jgi:esterase/lipase/1-acyl-sn-glycerol-3-phosphate acyltransferase
VNNSAYLATGRVISFMESLSRIRVRNHGQESIPTGSLIFVVNHFTRIETLLLPYHIYEHTRVPVWSLAHHTLFEGLLSGFLARIGAVSTRNPDRDQLIVKSLLTGEANWIIFPEGRMVKDKEAAESPSFFGLYGGERRAHTGAATLALRTEFYRNRLRHLLVKNPAESERLRNMFQIEDLVPVLKGKTWIVPVNLTYYPLRARENILSTLADRFAGDISDRLREELLTEGTMFFEGVDIDIRYGEAIPVAESLVSRKIARDMFDPRQINFDDQLPSLRAMRREANSLMNRFMADIYRMTTVNHDHLFATLLKLLPFDTISEADFRRRVFLLTDMVPDKSPVCCHHSLEIGQIALLTDDRYHKYRDFLELACETGVIHRADGVLQRVRAQLSADSEFHRVRIENPLGVAANEVQPLSALKRQIRLMAWLPEMVVRHRVADTLLHQGFEQFESDYRQYHLPELPKESSVGAPFLLKGTSRRRGIVLVHGFLAAPREMLELADTLHKSGYWVYCVRLRGHGTSPEDLAIRTGADWIESVDLGYALMSAHCTGVVVGGFSFGGGMALECAARITGLSGVFAVCPPFRLQDPSARFAPAVTTWNRLMGTIHLPGATKKYVENHSERPEINYGRIPLSALAELQHFMSRLEERLGAVQAPTLVVQAEGDPVVNAGATKTFFARIGSEQKEYLPLDINRHGILAGAGSGDVHRAIVAFIDGVSPESTP